MGGNKCVCVRLPLCLLSPYTMALPRRTPWRSFEDFEHVFGLLFASQGDPAAQRQGISRISTWQSRGTCPYAAETTANLLDSILRDAEVSASASSSTPSTSYRPPGLPYGSTNELRLAYSMALTRFVNSLVDPAQQSSFARSISSIAMQIGLPLWFVELRHAATHEDLPTLKICRDASRRAVDWLYSNYWLPQMQPPASYEDEMSALTVATEQAAEQVNQLKTLLIKYKLLQKEIVRDASMSKVKAKDILALEKKIEQWCLDFGSSSYGRAGLESLSTRNGERNRNFNDRRNGPDGDNEIERIGCSALVGVLVQSGFMVPTSKKKRTTGRTNELPVELLAIWEPLLDFLDDAFDCFYGCLLWELLEVLAATTDALPDPLAAKVPLDKSYLATVTAWSRHCLRKELQSDGESGYGSSEDIIRFCLLNHNDQIALLLKTLVEMHPHLAPSIESLVRLQRSQPALIEPANDDAQVESALAGMQQRLDEYTRRMQHANTAQSSQPAISHSTVPTSENETSNGGTAWRLVDEAAWTPCPFGMLSGGRYASLEVR